ncbi:MAG: 16S rRNA (adenine(1518)-N(6)/adenine(1519)-N(6))-dimethyltransferase RsmA [Sedimentisphaerales bacterium]|jgi:16S rRNA (adenine1518-N6/adenine1519-N6)-dimethyltransferase|nr:16S rRNA (adenine(1518)-N(6)/adenine(1519)-N(6))-dimethyltransferase RsmA [Sedimentisphaerales bacterium]
MQTKNQIQQLLQEAGLQPNKRFGQHFLIDLNLMRMLLEHADPGPEDVVLEVGTGTGSLTKALADRAGFVVGVEVDSQLAAITRQTISHKANVHLVSGDILAGKHRLNEQVSQAIEQARQIYKGRLLLVANLPYSAGSAVIVNLVVGPIVADAMTVTVQKEVADRLLAEPGTSSYGMLSILFDLTGQVDLIRPLPPSVFWPRPNVDSAIVHFVRDPEKAARILDMATLTHTIDLFMGHRRKMLKAIAKSRSARFLSIDQWLILFNRYRIDPTARPQDLLPEHYLELANSLARGEV